MTVDIRPAEDDDLEALVTTDFRNFGAVVEDGDVDEVRKEIALERFLVAVDDGQLIGAAGSFDMELSLPTATDGPCPTIPMSGVTWVSVAASNRRQGVLRRLMAGLDELSAGFGEPVMSLTASEGGIYERFGYGVATSIRCIEIDRRHTAIDPRWSPESVKLGMAADLQDHLFDVFDRFRLTQPGEVSRSRGFQELYTTDRKKPVFAAVHPDGYVLYEVEPKWNEGLPAHHLTIRDLVAVTAEAHLALWNLLLSVDLVGPISGRRAAAPDDPLPYFLTNPRALRTTDLNDGVWVKVTDPIRCFAARGYQPGLLPADGLTIAVVESNLDDTPVDAFTVAADGGCHPADGAPDLVATRAALGPLLLGVPASILHRGRRIAADRGVLDRADLVFGSARPPHSRTGF